MFHTRSLHNAKFNVKNKNLPQDVIISKSVPFQGDEMTTWP